MKCKYCGIEINVTFNDPEYFVCDKCSNKTILSTVTQIMQRDVAPKSWDEAVALANYELVNKEL